MTTIQTTCEDCGEVQLASGDIRVMFWLSSSRGTYAFRCPDCRLAVAKTAEPGVLDLLLSCGAKLFILTAPAEVFEKRSGPPITHDDLLAFHYALQQNCWEESQRGLSSNFAT